MAIGEITQRYIKLKFFLLDHSFGDRNISCIMFGIIIINTRDQYYLIINLKDKFAWICSP